MDYLTEKYRAILMPLIKQHLPGTSVYLFGSRAKKQNRPGSDIDIALDSGKPIDFAILSRLLTDIDESCVPVMVDLVDMNNTSKELLKQIQVSGVLWNS